jgi:chromate transporter
MTLWELVTYVGLYNLMTLSNGPVMVAMLEQTLVTQRHALSLDKVLFAFTVGRVTPGPASTYVASLGFFMFGVAGAVATTLAIVAPAYLVLPLIKAYERIRRIRRVESFMTGLIAAQVGLIVSSLVHLGRETLVSIPAVMILVTTFVLTHFFKQRAPVALAVAGAMGAVTRIWP